MTKDDLYQEISDQLKTTIEEIDKSIALMNRDYFEFDNLKEADKMVEAKLICERLLYFKFDNKK